MSLRPGASDFMVLFLVVRVPACSGSDAAPLADTKTAAVTKKHSDVCATDLRKLFGFIIALVPWREDFALAGVNINAIVEHRTRLFVSVSCLIVSH